MLGQRFGDRIPAKLDTDEELCGNNGEQDPALSAQLVALRIVQQLERLPGDGRKSHKGSSHIQVFNS